MANPNTQISGAIGTAQQFMPNAPQTYQQNLANVAPMGNPMARSTASEDTLATGLKQLGIAWREYTNDEEDRQEKIAKAVAPQIYTSMTDVDKQGLTARQILSTSGKFNLQDNEYAVATIDRMRGTEMGKRIESDWQIYDDQHKMQPDLPRQFDTFDEFYEERLKDYMMREKIENHYAFQSGLEEQHIATKMAVYDTFTKRRENQLKLERVNGITAMVGDWSRNNPNISTEAGIEDIKTFVGHIRETMTSDSSLEYKLLSNLAESVAKTGNASLVEAMGELEYSDGQSIKDVIDLSEYKDGANAEAIKIRNDRYIDLHKELLGAKTQEDLDAKYNEWKENSPEDYRMMAPLYEHTLANIKTEQARQQKLALMQQQRELETSNARAVAIPMLESMLAGKATFNGYEFPRTESDLKNMGIDVDTFTTIVRQVIENNIRAGNYDGLQYALANPLVGKSYRNIMNDQLETALGSMNQSGNIPEAVGIGLSLYRARPTMINQIMDPQLAGHIQTLATLQDTMGDEQGTIIFAQGMQNLRDPENNQRITKEISGIEIGAGNTLSIRTGSWDNVYINEDSEAFVSSIIRGQAKVFVATGMYNAQQAITKATNNTINSFINYDGVLLPRAEILEATGVSDEKFACEGIRYALDEIKSRHGYTYARVTYDHDQNLIYVQNIATGERDAYYPWDIGNRARTYLNETTAEERAIAEGRADTNKSIDPSAYHGYSGFY